MPQLQIRYSEAYDATLGGLTGVLDAAFFAQEDGAWERMYLHPGQQFATQCQQRWNVINDAVFAAFRSTGYSFPATWTAYAVHPWPGVVAFKDPLTVLIQADLDNVCNLLIHELIHCHEDYPPNQPRYMPVKEHIFARFAQEPIAVRYHLITHAVQWAVLQQVFPESWPSLVEQTKGVPILARVAALLDAHEAQMDYSDPLGSLLML
jgi:hypothetical protein